MQGEHQATFGGEGGGRGGEEEEGTILGVYPMPNFLKLPAEFYRKTFTCCVAFRI